MDVIPLNLLSYLPPRLEVIPTSDSHHSQVALSLLHSNMLKKFQPEGTNQAADKAALDLFLESNARCSSWKVDESSYYHDVFLKARQILHARFFSGELQAPLVSLKKCWDKLKPGPGSSIGTKLTDFVGKMFNSSVTAYDSSLWHHYKQNIPTLWQQAETIRERQYGSCSEVRCARLTYARKNYDISRVINTEASLNMLYQLAIGSQIEDCLKEWFNISLDTQPNMNRFMARLGSLYGTHATIDLKSASDLNSENFIRWFIPVSMYMTLDSVRSKLIKLPDDSHVELSIFSTMGNGFTFPLQTMIFSCIVEAVYLSMGLPVDNTGELPAFSVFGDDIICVRAAYYKVCRALEFAGHIVNYEKSFNDGGFRESCGKDYFKGHDVRAVYLKRFSHETHYFSFFNRIARWSIRNGIDMSDLLLHLKGLAKFQPVPFDESDDSGHKVPRAVALRFGNGKRYKASRKRPKRVSTKGIRELNPIGLLIGALGGYLTSAGRVDPKLTEKQVDALPTGYFVERDRPCGAPNYKVQRASTPSWDWMPQRDLTPLDYELLYSSLI